MEEEKNLLESGTYKILGTDNGEISLDKIKLTTNYGKERIWKVKSITEKKIILEVIKF